MKGTIMKDDGEACYWLKRESGFTGGFVFTLGKPGEPGILVKRLSSERAVREYMKRFNEKELASFRNVAGIRLR